jgi:hypothetical protein
MSDQRWPDDPEVAELAERLDAQRPRPGRGLRRRVRAVVSAGLRARALRRQSVVLVTTGMGVLLAAAALAATAPT